MAGKNKNKKNKKRGVITAAHDRGVDRNDNEVVESPIKGRKRNISKNEAAFSSSSSSSSNMKIIMDPVDPRSDNSPTEAGDANDDHDDGRHELNSSDEDYISSEEEGEDLILEGMLVRNKEVASSDDEDEDDDNHSSNGDNDQKLEPKNKKAKLVKDGNKDKADNIKTVSFTNDTKKQSGQGQTKSSSSYTTNQLSSSNKSESDSNNQVEVIQIEFTFHDMNEKFYHGLKTQLLSNPIYAPHASFLSDLMIDNVSVGTVLSNDDGGDNVFGYASVLNVTTNQNEESIQYLKQTCLKACPKPYLSELTTVLGGQTKRPAGFLLHGRMVNLPLEITLTLHQQLVLDMDWAVEHAEGGEEERKALDFGVLVLLAPCSRDRVTHSVLYRNFDDEVFASHSEFVFEVKEILFSGKNKGISSSHATTAAAAAGDDTANEEDLQLVNVVVMTKTGHREAMKELERLIQT